MATQIFLVGLYKGVCFLKSVYSHTVDGWLLSLREDMLDYAAAKASHAVLLCTMEQGKVKDWPDVDDFDRTRVLGVTEDNHPSAKKFARDMHAYIAEELSYGAMIGPLGPICICLLMNCYCHASFWFVKTCLMH